MDMDTVETGRFVLKRKKWIIPLCRPLLDLAFLYHRITVEGGDNLPRQGPALLLVKHRASRDAPLVAMVLHRYTKRGANYFMKGKRSPISNAILAAMGGVKVVRPKDVRRVQNRDERKAYIHQAREANQQVMAYVTGLYSQGEVLVAFPEGMFYADKVGPLQTAVIKHALAVEQEYGFSIPLIPVGLDYENPKKPRSRAFIRVGTPLRAALFDEQKQLIAMVKQRLHELSGFAPLQEKLGQPQEL